MVESEAVLIRRCQSGCRESFDLLYRRHGSAVLQIARGIMGNEQDAEDAVQEVFVRVLGKIGQFRSEASFSSWIRVLAANVCRDTLRKMSRHPAASFKDLCAANEAEMDEGLLPVSQAEELVMKELLENLHEKLNRLKKEYQRLIILRYIDGLSYRKIAQLLGCSQPLVKSRLHQARKNLRRICQDLRAER